MKNNFPNVKTGKIRNRKNEEYVAANITYYDFPLLMQCILLNNKLNFVTFSADVVNKTNNILFIKEFVKKFIDKDLNSDEHYMLTEVSPTRNGEEYIFQCDESIVTIIYGQLKDSEAAGILINFTKNPDYKNEHKDVIANNNFNNIPPIEKDTLPFGLKFGDPPTKVKSVVQQQCIHFEVKEGIGNKNTLIFTGVLKYDQKTFFYAVTHGNSLDELGYMVPIWGNKNNNITADSALRRISYELENDKSAKIISSSFGEKRSDKLLALPYALIKIVSEEGDERLKEAFDSNVWTLTVNFTPIPTAVYAPNKRNSIDEIADTLNELKK